MVVGRCFYTEEFIVIIDALTRQKNIVKDEDLAALLKLHQRHVRKILNELEKDKLVRKEDRKEQKEKTYPNERNSQVAHTYWYIDYKHFIDVVRYRIHRLHEEIQSERDMSASVDFKCDCGKTYSMLEAAHLFNPSTSNLHCRCGRVLTQRTNSSQYQQENPLIEMLKPISDLLRAVKDMPLPVVSKIPATPHSLGLVAAPAPGVVPTPVPGKASVTVQAPKVIVQIAASTPSGLSDFGARMQGINPTPQKEAPKKKELPNWWKNKEVEEAKAKAKAKQDEELQVDNAYEENPDPDLYNQFLKTYLKQLKDQFKTQASTPLAVLPIVEPSTTTATSSTTTPSTVTVNAITKQNEEPTKPMEEEEEFEEDEEMITVGGKPMRLSEVTSDHYDLMTTEEYEEYHRRTASDVIY